MRRGPLKLTVYQYHYLPISETFIYRQLQGLAAEFDLDILTLGLMNLDVYPGFTPLLVPNRSLWEMARKKCREMTFSPRQIRFMTKKLRGSSLLHINFGHMAVGLKDVIKETNIPATCFFYGVDASAMLRDPNYVAEYARANFAAVFTISNDMKRRLSPFLAPGTKIFVNNVGLPLELFPFKRRTEVKKGATFVQISRLDYKKGIDISLNVFKRYLSEHDPGAKFIIAGDGPLKAVLQQQTAALNIEENVNFIGSVRHHQIIDLLLNSDVFLQHSVTAPDGDMEGIPIIIEEAMACGIPVISTYHAGIPELVQDGITGFLVNERDEQGYLEKMISLTRTDIGAVSLNARKHIEENFDVDKTNRQLCGYLRSIIT